MKGIQILIIDLGSQYTLVIGRTLRELGIRLVILPPLKAEVWLKENMPKGIILSGGSASVYQQGAPSPPTEILKRGIPILGICYGMQWLAQKLGGSVVASRGKKEYGQSLVVFDMKEELFSCLNRQSVVWASHGDSVEVVPSGFKETAKSTNGVIAAMSDSGRKIWGVQFHPEVTQTNEGKTMLRNFLETICECEKDWVPEDIISHIRQEVITALQGRKAIIGFSGGVDSSTLTAILFPALKEKLLAVCLDTGGLRMGELKQIKETARTIGVKLQIVKVARRFQKALCNATHSEVKRRRFAKLYAEILRTVAKEFGAVIIQGSLAADFIESGKAGQAIKIKSHHNVGLAGLHPLNSFFKYEIRDLANEVGLPKQVRGRQPFPGPGLFIRIIGAPVTFAKLSLVRWADAEATDIFKKHELYDEISQLVVALDCTRTVGIKGDGRVYGFAVIVRAVKTSDFMTAVGYQLPAEVRREISTILTQHPKVVRVYFDETNKPPATTELE